jgi:hypothetical protein
MAFIGVRCPECRSRELKRKRRSGVRYKKIINDTDHCLGEYRYYHLECLDCRLCFYIEDRHLYEQREEVTQKRVITEAEFLKASIHKPGSERIGSTAGEFTLKIAAGADHPYAIKYLEMIYGKRNDDKKRESIDLLT